MNCYEGDYGHTYSFNDPVIVNHCQGTESDRVGRLIQIRNQAGAWGSDLYFIRLNDGRLVTFENVALGKWKGDVAPPYEGDSVDEEYSFVGKYPETGFIIKEPSGPPPRDQSFSMTIRRSK